MHFPYLHDCSKAKLGLHKYFLLMANYFVLIHSCYLWAPCIQEKWNVCECMPIKYSFPPLWIPFAHCHKKCVERFILLKAFGREETCKWCWKGRRIKKFVEWTLSLAKVREWLLGSLNEIWILNWVLLIFRNQQVL